MTTSTLYKLIICWYVNFLFHFDTLTLAEISRAVPRGIPACEKCHKRDNRMLLSHFSYGKIAFQYTLHFDVEDESSCDDDILSPNQIDIVRDIMASALSSKFEMEFGPPEKGGFRELYLHSTISNSITSDEVEVTFDFRCAAQFETSPAPSQNSMAYVVYDTLLTSMSRSEVKKRMINVDEYQISCNASSFDRVFATFGEQSNASPGTDALPSTWSNQPWLDEDSLIRAIHQQADQSTNTVVGILIACGVIGAAMTLVIILFLFKNPKAPTDEVDVNNRQNLNTFMDDALPRPPPSAVVIENQNDALSVQVSRLSEACSEWDDENTVDTNHTNPDEKLINGTHQPIFFLSRLGKPKLEVQQVPVVGPPLVENQVKRGIDQLEHDTNQVDTEKIDELIDVYDHICNASKRFRARAKDAHRVLVISNGFDEEIHTNGKWVESTKHQNRQSGNFIQGRTLLSGSLPRPDDRVDKKICDENMKTQNIERNSQISGKSVLTGWTSSISGFVY